MMGGGEIERRVKNCRMSDDIQNDVTCHNNSIHSKVFQLQVDSKLKKKSIENMPL